MDLNLFGKYQKATKKSRRTERGDLVVYFTQRINHYRKIDGYKSVTTGFIGYKLTGIPTRDLYYLRSHCDQEDARGTPFGKTFWYMIQERTKRAQRAQNV